MLAHIGRFALKVISASIVRGTAQPGVEVTFRGEGSDNVAIHLKDENVGSMSDSQIYLHAKQLLTQIMAFTPDDGTASN